MMAKIKGKFLPSDYQLTLFIQMQNLRQRLMTVKEYTEEFYKVSIRAGQIQDTTKKVYRYVNGLKLEIQDEIGIFSPKTVEEAYQIAITDEEKLLRNNSAKRKRYFPRKRKSRW